MKQEQQSAFAMGAIPDDIWETMQGRTFHENPWITREMLSYLKVIHWGFDKRPHQGELIVNKQIAEEVLEIMELLYKEKYPIEKIRRMDEYEGDDNRAMADNNSSGFNYRVIAGTSRLSKHGLGLAIDINPLYNPYIRRSSRGELLIEPEGSSAYADRTRDFPYKITEKDLCCRLFKERGYIWGGDWNTVKDYQHFQKNIE